MASKAKRLLIAWFDDDEHLIEAVKRCRERGYAIDDCYTPFPVHGLDEALGRRPSRITLVCFVFGLLGALTALWLQTWTSVHDWPLVIGGKPEFSLPAFIPVTFELTVLFAACATVLALLILARLYPGKKPARPLERVHDDRFALVLFADENGINLDRASTELRQWHAVDVQQRVET